MIERLAFQLGFLGQRPKQTKTPLPLAEWLGLSSRGLDSLQTIQPISKPIPTKLARVDRLLEASL